MDCCGRHLRVVFPGRRWGGPGPDFLGALLVLRDGTLLRGDVELHPRASGWAGHHHARDPAYAHVVLHVVQNANLTVPDGCGGHVATVRLEPLPPPIDGELALGRGFALGPCMRGSPSVQEVVAAAGRERFRGRVARFEGDLAVAPPDQVVWRALAEALGYVHNTRPFGELAEAVPWLEAAQVVRERGPLGLAGLLLGTAGLLGEASLPEAQHWRALQRARGVRPLLGRTAWQRAQVRRANAPATRCRGLAELAARWAESPRLGLAEQVQQLVASAAEVRRPQLWRFAHAPPWIGRGRAQTVAINVLVPFAAAAGLDELSRALWERLPGEPPNRVVRYMAEQLGGPVIRFRGACQQQGLLQVFKSTCAARVCERCPAREQHLSVELG